MRIDSGYLQTWLGHDRGTPVNPVVWWGRLAAWVGAVAYTPAFVNHPRSAASMDTWLYRVHFVFHEAGHVVFGPFGATIGALGGTLMQLILPFACVVAFVRVGNPVAGALCTWWLGTSLATVAPYAYDARLLELPLHGGFTGAERPEVHDWFYVLGSWDLLNANQTIAWGFKLGADAMMLGGLLWAALVLKQQWAVKGAPPIR